MRKEIIVKALSYPKNLFLDAFYSYGINVDLENDSIKDIEKEVDEFIMKDAHQINFKESINSLDHRERIIIKSLYEENMLLKDCAPVIGVTLARVGQIRNKTLRKIRRDVKLPPKTKNENNEYIVKINDPIEFANFSSRAYNALKLAGIHTMYDLVNHTEHDIYSMRKVGPSRLKEIKTVVSDLGFKFKEE